MAIPKGLKVSINNTPQGNNDTEGFGEMVAGTIQYVDVLANDLGGGSTTLVGFWNAALPSNLGNLLNPGALATTFTGSGTGAQISIENNQVKYDFSAFADDHYDHLAAGATVVDTFYYVLRMGNGAFAVAKVDVTITGENDGPNAVDDSNAATDNGIAATGSLLTNDSDVDDGDAIALAAGEAGEYVGTYGTLTINADGTYSYIVTDESLDDGDVGLTDSFDYTITDGDANDTATLTITVNGQNDAPVSGGDDSANGSEDDASIGGTVPVATDLDIEDLTYALVSGSVEVDGVAAANGTVTFNANGTYSYAPTLADQGLDDGESREITFQYVANDGTVNSDAATVTLTVNGANDAPVSSGDDSANGSEDDASIGGTVPVATDVDIEDLTYALVSGSVEVDGVAAANGTVTFNANGTYSYAPTLADQDLNDGDSKVITFQYVANDGDADSAPATVTITVNGATDAPANTDPVAANDKWIISEGASFTIPLAWLISNDSDADSDPLSITGTSALPAWMTANYDVDGNLVSISVNNAALGDGSESFTYTLSDGQGGTATGTVDVVLKDLGTGSTADPINLSAETYDYSYVDTLNGDDVITAGGGTDSLIGGAGLDTIKISAPTSDVIDGGSNANSNLAGTNLGDILVFDGILDLTAVPQTSISNIETVSMADALGNPGADSMKLDASDVINMGTGTFNPFGTALAQADAIRVNGDAGDTLNLSGGGWSVGAPAVSGAGDAVPAGYTLYVHDGNAAAGIQADAYVLVQTNISTLIS